MFSLYTAQEKFINGGFTIKSSNDFTLQCAGEIYKRRFHSKNAQMFLLYSAPEKFINGGFTLKMLKCFHSTVHQRNL